MNVSLLEKLAVGVLVCAWVIYGSNFLGNILVSVDEHGPAMAAVDENAMAATDEAEPAEAEPEVDVMTLLANADPSAGEKVFGKCKACHSIEQGGPNKVGPNLYGVVGGPVASADGFSYSGALEEHGGEWDYASLNAFLKNPKEYVPGTKMSFAGLKKPEDRADVIAYLRTNSDSPPPLP